MSANSSARFLPESSFRLRIGSTSIR